jgi:hypothetical protein
VEIKKYTDAEGQVHYDQFEPVGPVQSYGVILTAAEAAKARVDAATGAEQKRLRDAYEKDLENQRVARAEAERSCKANLENVSDEEVTADKGVGTAKIRLDGAEESAKWDAEGLKDKVQALNTLRQFNARVAGVLTVAGGGTAAAVVSAVGLPSKEVLESVSEGSQSALGKASEMASELGHAGEPLSALESAAAGAAPALKVLEKLKGLKEIITGGEKLPIDVENLEKLSEELRKSQATLLEKQLHAPNKEELERDIKRLEKDRENVEKLKEKLLEAEVAAYSRAFFRHAKKMAANYQACVDESVKKTLPDPYRNLNVAAKK